MSRISGESPGDDAVVHTVVTDLDERVDYLRSSIAEGIREAVATGSTQERKIWFECMKSLYTLEKSVEELYAIEHRNQQNEDD